MRPPPYAYPYSSASTLDPRITLPRPPIDPALAPLVDAYLLPEELDLNLMRGISAKTGEPDPDFIYTADTVLAQAPEFEHTEYGVPGFGEGGNENVVMLSVFAPKDDTSNKALPAIYHIHGGGMVSGNRFSAVPELIELLRGPEITIPYVLISVEYRLAPETPAPAAVEDCYAGLLWTTQNFAMLGIDPRRIVVWGCSGGGGLAAGVCLSVRDGPRTSYSESGSGPFGSEVESVNTKSNISIRAQVLISPMLDDRCDTLSDRQFEFGSPWCGVSNRMAWDCIFGRTRSKDIDSTSPEGPEAVPPWASYQSPARITDLTALPATYIDVGECEVFRDAAVQYATRLWGSGISCELHVWPGAFHLFDAVDNPGVPVVGAARAAKRAWLGRIWSG
ncbi:alpha/beta hydrolase, partial [Aspergillus foveolatus]|uniref:alpha/beta hydrolase n=1 Tax=Aspergillus foveolatus TaxID=210207 RepID=UPI003CCD34B6